MFNNKYTPKTPQQVFCFLLLLLFFLPLRAQQIPEGYQRELNRAQSYEHANNWDGALAIYRKLFEQNPSDLNVYTGIKTSLFQLKRYGELIDFLEMLIRQRGTDFNMLGDLGNAYYKSDQTERALATWQKIISLIPNSSASYRIVASLMIENRLYDEALATYQKGWEKIRENQFLLDIGYLYSIRLNFTEATREYLTFLNKEPNNYPVVESRILVMTSQENSLEPITDELKSAITKNPNHLLINRLLGGLLIRQRNWIEAFKVFEEMDKLQKSNGQEFYNFGNQLYNEAQYTLAESVFVLIRNRFPQTPLLPNIRLNQAQCLEAESQLLPRTPAEVPAENKTIISDQLQKSIGLYEDLIKDYPKSAVAASALNRLGEIYFVRFHQPQKALDYFEILLNRFPLYAYSATIRLNISDCFISLKEYGQATKELENVRSLFPQQNFPALYKLAMLDVLQNNIPKAQEKLDLLIQGAGTGNSLTNDALNLKLFLSSVQNDPILIRYIQSENFARQFQYKLAIQSFKEISDQNPKSALADASLKRAGELEEDVGAYNFAAETYHSLILKFPSSLYFDDVQMKIADIYLIHLNNPNQALIEYEKILTNNPNSIFIDAARRKIAEIRKNQKNP